MSTSYGRAVVTAALDEIGVDYQETFGSVWAAALCPLHDDTSPSFTVNLEEGGWRCRAGCGSHGDLAVLVAQVTDENVDDVRRRLRSGMPGGVEALDGLGDRPAVKEVRTVRATDLEYDTTRVPRYIVRRGFTMETLKAWRVGQVEDGAGVRVVIPVYQAGVLRGLVRRAVGDLTPKYLNTPGLASAGVLLGLDHLPTPTRSVVVVEGPFDALWCYQAGIPALSVLGSSLSEEQAEIIRRRFWEATILFDADAPGRSGAHRALRLLGGFMSVRVATLPAGQDPQDTDPDQLRQVVAQAAPGGVRAR